MVSNTRFALAISLLTLAAAQSEFPYPHPVRPLPAPKGCGGEVECPACNAAPRDCHERVRRSWSTLTDLEKHTFIDAVRILKATPTNEGRQVYGPDFTNYNELVLHHASGVADNRGDQAHLDQHFVFFHRLLILKFENALLSVAPDLLGSPYWDLRDGVDALFGPGPLSFGSTTGTGPNYEVEDGAFADWTVASYADHEEAVEWIPAFRDYKDLIFNNETGDLLIRSSAVPTRSLVRYPACTDDAPGPLYYTPEDYEACVQDASTFEEFYWCLEAPSRNAVHEAPHFWVGSADSSEYGYACPSFAPPNLKKVRQGDYIDKLTSTNDPIFFLHHAFVDLMSVDYMRRHAQDAGSYWGFKAWASDDSAPRVEGTFLMDVVGGDWPFSGSELLTDAGATGAPQTSLTFWETMCWLGPQTAIYTYDKFLWEDGVQVCGSLVVPIGEEEPNRLGDMKGVLETKEEEQTSSAEVVQPTEEAQTAPSGAAPPPTPEEDMEYIMMLDEGMQDTKVSSTALVASSASPWLAGCTFLLAAVFGVGL